MRQLLTGLMVAALALALTASAQAGRSGGGHRGHSGHNMRSHQNNRGGHVNRGHQKNASHGKFTGTRHGNHWRFRGKYGHHWSRNCWSKRYGCQCYYCPTTSCWYYWNQDEDCYCPLDGDPEDE